MTLWVLIPMCILLYVLLGFLSGIFFASISRAKPPKGSEDYDERFENYVIYAVFWPVAFPCYIVVNFGHAVGIMLSSYVDFLEHVHRKTHKIDGTG